jgi:hypothetical protein
MRDGHRLLTLLDNSSGNFSALSISGCILWLRPLLTAMYADSALTTPCNGTDTEPIAGWADESGAGNNAIQATGGIEPTLLNNAQAGRPALLFNGTTRYLRCDGITDDLSGTDVPFTLSFAFKKNGNVATQVGFGVGNSAAANPFLSVDTSGTTLYSIRKRDIAGVSATANDTGIDPDTTTWHIYTVRQNGTTVDAWIDGFQSHIAVTQNVGVLTVDRGAIGALVNVSGVANFWNGYIGEVALYNRALSDGEAAQLRAGMRGRWGV